MHQRRGDMNNRMIIVLQGRPLKILEGSMHSLCLLGVVLATHTLTVHQTTLTEQAQQFCPRYPPLGHLRHGRCSVRYCVIPNEYLMSMLSDRIMRTKILHACNPLSSVWPRRRMICWVTLSSRAAIRPLAGEKKLGICRKSIP